MSGKVKLNKPVVILTKDELIEYNDALAKLDAADTMIEIKAWQRKIESILEKARPHQEERRKRKTVLMTPVVILTKEELQEYNEAFAKLDAAETMVEINAWYRKIQSILQKAKAREEREIRRKAALYDLEQARKEQSATISFA